MPYVVTDGCILCGACSAGCESDAITEDDVQAHIDVNICIECGTCEINCPSEAIVYMSESEYEAFSVSKGENKAITS